MLRHEERSQKKDLRRKKKRTRKRETNLTQNEQKDGNNGDQ